MPAPERIRYSLFGFWKGILLGVPLWWVLGLNIGIYHLAAFYLLVTFFLIGQQSDIALTVPFSFLLLLCLSFTYAFSLFIHFPSAPPIRVLASSYNLSFWVVGSILILMITNCFDLKDIRKWLSIFPYLASWIGFLGVILGIAKISGIYDMTFPTPLYGLMQYVGQEILLEKNLIVEPLYRDWINSVLYSRLNLFSPYPTATGAVILMVLAMLPAWAKVERKEKSLFYAFLWISNLVALYLTLSRMAIVALCVAFLLVFLAHRKKFILWGFLFFLGMVLAASWIEQFLNWILTLRENSTFGRLALYQYTLNQLEGMDWILGLGLKPRETFAFAVPIGSHSTYLSLLFKTGYVGTFVFVVFQVYLFWRWYRLKGEIIHSQEARAFWQGAGRVLFGMSMWMLTEDLDAPQLVCFLYFSVIGMLEGLRRQWTA